MKLKKKTKPFREPCDWWFHGGVFNEDKWGNRIPDLSTSYCANKKSIMYLSRVCPRQTCEDHVVNREGRKGI